MSINKIGDSVMVDLDVHAGKIFNSIIYLHNTNSYADKLIDFKESLNIEKNH